MSKFISLRDNNGNEFLLNLNEVYKIEKDDDNMLLIITYEDYKNKNNNKYIYKYIPYPNKESLIKIWNLLKDEICLKLI